MPESETDTERQIEQALRVGRRHLGANLVAACLYGSATAGGLRRWSDLDLLLLVAERPTEAARKALATDWLPLSGAPGTPGRRPLEATLLALPDIRPWRYPPWRVLQFGEWLRADIERGVLEPVQADPDIALLIAQAWQNGRPLLGPAPLAILDSVPAGDLRRAIADSIPHLLEGWREDTRNSLLTLARMWMTAATGDIRSKDDAADWAIHRLPPAEAVGLQRARDDYLGLSDEDWQETDPLRPLVERLTRETEACLAGAVPPI